MYTIEKTVKFEAGHRLMNYKGKCKNIHGHNYVVKIGIADISLDKNDMVLDFSEFLRKTEQYIIENLDHAMLLNVNDIQWVKIFKKNEMKTYLINGDPTAEKIAEDLYSSLSCMMPQRDKGYKLMIEYIEVEENSISKARYEKI